MLGNLRSISIRTMQEKQKSKLGLVVEGGGVRAIYAAGVLDVLHDMCLPFSGVIGVSAEIRDFSVSEHGFAPAISLTTTFAIVKSVCQKAPNLPHAF